MMALKPITMIRTCWLCLYPAMQRLKLHYDPVLIMTAAYGKSENLYYELTDYELLVGMEAALPLLLELHRFVKVC